MYSTVTRDGAFTRRLCDFIGESYPVAPVEINPAKRGFYGETWRVESPQGRFFAKFDCSPHQSVYERSFPVIDHLCSHGIDYISKIVKTRDSGLCCTFESGVLGLFEWIDGENREDENSKPHEYQMLAKVYAIDPAGLEVPQEDFSSAAADMLFGRWARVEDETILALLESKRNAIEHSARRLRQFSGICAEDRTGFAVTHGDAGGNVLVHNVPARNGTYHIVDWDGALLAPPERDAWFCLHWPWAMHAFRDALRQNGIAYALRPERLAYYCYHMYFFYLNEILEAHFALGGVVSAYLSDYLSGWMNDNRAFCERTIA